MQNKKMTEVATPRLKVIATVPLQPTACARNLQAYQHDTVNNVP